MTTGVDTDWDHYALSYIQEYAGRVVNFTANDLWASGLNDPPAPLSPARLGLLIKKAAAAGIIRKVGLSATRRGNGGIIMRWRATGDKLNG